MMIVMEQLVEWMIGREKEIIQHLPQWPYATKHPTHEYPQSPTRAAAVGSLYRVNTSCSFSFPTVLLLT
jgi:hypothetical protein